MLPIILVLLFASSALAAPLQLSLNHINEVAPVPSNGSPVGGFLLTNAFDSMDGGDKSVYVSYLLNILPDIANVNHPISQAQGLAEAVAVLIELSTGYPGDACAAANFIDSYVLAVRSGNLRGARAAAASYVSSLANGLNSIVQLAVNPASARFASGRRGNCQSGGAGYQFEAAWDLVLSSAPSAELAQEQYCAVKSLFNGFTATSRNVAAAATAAAQSHVVEAFSVARIPVANFLSAVASGSAQIGQAARAAAQALISAANNL